MAHSDKNIVITPNIGSSTDDPKIVFSGADANYGAQNITLRVYPVNNGTLSFEGLAGQLLSLSNNYSGFVFQANDLSGTPYIEVLDSGLVRIAQYPGNVLIGTPNDNGNDKLQVSGSILSTSIIKGATLTSTVATGTAPLTVTSSTMVSNLNAQYWNGNSFSSYLNQGVRTSDSPTFDQIYANGWFRNNSNNTGLYNQNTTQHWSSTTNGYWDASSTTTFSAIRFYTGSHLGTLRGSVYANDSNEIGFLNTSGGWRLRVDNSSTVYATTFSGALSGNATTATTASAVAASGITGQTGMWTSANRPGPYRLYRRDDDSNYSVQTNWNGTHWVLYGYNGDSGHAGCRVAYADSAGNGGVTSVNGQTGAVTVSGGSGGVSFGKALVFAR
jgi:hypothetical protein